MNNSLATELKNNKGSRQIFTGIHHRWQLVLFILAHLFIFIVLFQTIYKMQYSATGIYFGFASRVLEGNIPYQDFTLEYPPFSLLFFILPRLVASTWSSFSIYYQAEVVIIDIIGILIIYAVARKTANPPWIFLMIYTLCILAMGPIIGQQYDLFPAVMSLLSIYIFWAGKHKTSWVVLALATLTKIFPVVIAPVFLIHYLRNSQWKHLWQGLMIFSAVILIVLLPFLISSPASLKTLYDYHALRGIQVESIYSSFLLAADKLGLISINTGFGYGSWNVLGPSADVLSKVSTVILGILLVLAYCLIYLRTKKGNPRILQLSAFSMLAILIVICSSKILSPQYMIWLIPLIPLFSERTWLSVLIAFLIAGALTYYLFPWNYINLTLMNNPEVAVLFFRNCLLIAMGILIVVSLVRGQERSQRTPPAE